jgi:MFS family permease
MPDAEAPDNAADASQPDRPASQPSLWQNRDYVGWWTGNTVSALGTSVSAIAYPLLVLFATGSVGKAGLVGSAELVGVLASTLWGGALADRVSRRAILTIGPLVQAIVLGAVAIVVRAGHVSIPLLVLAALLTGLSAGVVMGASTPALRRIVPKEQIATANGQMLGRDLAAQLLGAPAGGFLFGVARWLPFGADAISYLFAAAGAAAIRTPLGPDRQAHEADNTMLQDIAAGFSFVRQQPFLLFVVCWASVLNAVAQAFTLLFIALVKYRGGGPGEIGVISAVALAGGIAGSVIGPALAQRVRPKLLVRGAAWAFALAFGIAAIVPRPWEIGIVIFIAMLTMVPMNVIIQSYVVRLVPDHLSGRVTAVSRFGLYALEWTGPLLAGGLATLFGVPGGTIALLIVMVPLAIALHVTRSLAILDTPVERVTEAADPRAQVAAAADAPD